MKNIKSERGQALIIFALAAIGLFGIVGLAIDGSAKFSDRRHAQNAADTAALAAALAKSNALKDPTNSTTPAECPAPIGVLPSDVCAELTTAALNLANENGYDNNSGKEVDVYSPPISGYYDGDPSYVQVIISSDVNTTFSRVVGIEQTHNVVEAVALTKEGGELADGAMIISYDDNPSCGVGGGGGSVDVSGTGRVNLNGGGIFLNSGVACGFATNCTDLTINPLPGQPTPGINSAYSGDNIDQDGCSAPAPEFPGQDPVAIPQDVSWPDVPPECSMAYATPTLLGSYIDPGPPSRTVQEWLIYPGYYDEFPQATLVANKSDIYMKSGVYCIDPGGTSHDWDLSWSGTDAAKLIGSTESSPGQPNYNKYHAYNPDGVTLYIKSGGGFTLNSNNPTFLDASTSGDLQGYLMVVEGTHTDHPTCSITGGADIDINGLIFAPYCDMTINGGSGTSAEINAQLIVWDIKITGGAEINFNYDPSNQVTIKDKIGLMK